MLSSASTKLISTRDTLLERLDSATPETLLTPSSKILRAQLEKPLLPTPAISSLRSLVDHEQQLLSDLNREHTAITGEVSLLTAEIFNQNNRLGNGKEKQGARIQLDQALVAKVQELNREIDVLGDEEIKELEKEKKVEAQKKAKIAEFFQALDEEE